MIYYFSYMLEKKFHCKACYTLREAEIFFDILISAGAEYIRVNTVKRRAHNDKKRF